MKSYSGATSPSGTFDIKAQYYPTVTEDQRNDESLTIQWRPCDYTVEILNDNGTCSVCPDWTHPDIPGKECVSDNCDYTKEFFRIDGRCEHCDDYTHPNSEDVTQCIADECDYVEEILTLDGKCYLCDDYTHPNEISTTACLSRWNSSTCSTQCVADPCDFYEEIIV